MTGAARNPKMAPMPLKAKKKPMFDLLCGHCSPPMESKCPEDGTIGARERNRGDQEGRTDSTGSKLERKLREKGISKRQLAEMSFVSYRTVRRIASGDRLGYLDTWLRFADALGCELSDILEGPAE